jgi:branched-chain amino acid transport system permease protein
VGTTLLQQILNGLVVGSLYALLALGYTLIYGVLRLFNFAHGDIFMVGAYVAIWVLGVVGATHPLVLPLLAGALALAVAAAAMSGAALGVVVERLAYRPVRRAPRIMQLISVLGASILIENSVLLWVGPAQVYFPPLLPTTTFSLGGVIISTVQVIILAVAVALMIGILLLVNRTWFGLALRATSQSFLAASLMGIDINRIIVLTFVIGPAIGAASGLMYGAYYGIAFYTMGFVTGIKAFTAAVLGGIGNVQGALLGGLLLGLLENVGAGWLPVLTNGALGSEYKDVFAFAVLILILTLKPTGLLGER